MRILVVGGTRFVGRHVVQTALDRDHEVTLLHRGRTGPDLFPAAEHLVADRDGDLAVLDGRGFDATVDVCAYRPTQVHHLADALGGRGGQHLFVSTVSAYVPPTGPGITEDAELHTPPDPEVTEVTDDTYGPLKVACEQAAAARHGDGLLVIRPTYVVGPHDYTWRFPYWVHRIAAGGRVLCPGDPEAPMQVIDGRDQAAFMVDLLERGDGGTFHTVSPAPPYGFGDLLDAVAATVAPAGTTLEWVDGATLLAAGLDDSALPLWDVTGVDWWAGACDPARAYAAGLAPRPLQDTVRDTLAWTVTSSRPDAVGVGADREAELLDHVS
jgi:2'-hydroxyisoflavone reductase